MKETIYNLYAFAENGHIDTVGIAQHTMDCTDSEKDRFLKELCG